MSVHMDSSGCSLAERQEYELQALQAIYLDDVLDLRETSAMPPEVQIRLGPQESMSEAVAHTSINLIVKFTRTYPEEVPEIRLDEAKCLSNQQVAILKQELDLLAKKLVGEEMVLALCQHAQTFLRANNKPPSKSFYDEMLQNRQLLEQKAARAVEKRLELERQKEMLQLQQIEQEIQRKQEALKEDNRRRREMARQHEKDPSRTSRSCSPGTQVWTRKRGISVPGTTESNDGFEELGVPSIEGSTLKFRGKEDSFVYKGKCLGRSSVRGSQVYLGIDAKSCDLVVITEWDLQRTQCVEPESSAAKFSDQMLSIEHELVSLSGLRHVNIVRCLGFSYSVQPPSIKIAVLTEYVGGNNLSTWIQRKLPMPVELLRYCIRETLDGLAYLHNKSVIHEDLRLTSLFLGNTGHIVIGDYSIGSRILDLAFEIDSRYRSQIHENIIKQRTKRASKKTDIYSLGVLILSLVQGHVITNKVPEIPSDIPSDLKDFLQRCLDADDGLRWSVNKLMVHTFVKTPINKCLTAVGVNNTQQQFTQHRTNAITSGREPQSDETREDDDADVSGIPYIGASTSRLNSEFQILSEIGRGAFGDVIKVRNKLDGRCYAIKRIPLNSAKKQLTKKITREVKLLSRLNHENVVRYFNSWIETTEELVSSETTSTQSPSKSHSPSTPSGKHRTASCNTVSFSFVDNVSLMEPRVPASAGGDAEFSSDWNNVAAAGDSASDDETDVNSDSDDDNDDFDGGVFRSFRLFSDDSDDSVQFVQDSDGLQNEEDSSTEDDKTSKKLIVTETSQLIGRRSPGKLQFLYIQMEFCEKSTLRDCIDAGLYRDVNRVWQLFREIVDGLAHIHDQGMIHRDLKPVNIFLDMDNHVKIGDFGLATTDIIAATETGILELSLHNADKSDSTGEHDAGVGGSLTGHVGTAMYVSPEVLTCSGRYNQKVDLYSLGVIFFEMCYRPMFTGMERIKILTNLRSPSIELPDDFSELELDKQAYVIRWLLNHDPSKRPTSKELLKSDFLPPPQMEESELHEVLRSTIANPDSAAYKHMIRTIFSKSTPLPAADFTYDSDLFKNAALLATSHGLCQRAVTDVVERIFRKHGAVRLSVPLLMPKCSLYDSSDVYVCVMDHSGLLIGLPYDSKVPFARYVARSGITQLKRYSIDNVYRENRLPGLHPRELAACSFDIVTSSATMSSVADAEVIALVKDVMSEIPALSVRSCRLRVNHTSLVKAVLIHCGIAEDLHADVYAILGDSKVEKQQKLQIRTRLCSLSLSDQCVDQLCNFIFHETEFREASHLRSITKASGQAGSLAKTGFYELDTLQSHIEALGCKLPYILAVGLLSNIQHYSGMLFQIVYDIKRNNRTSIDVIAAGGRYDRLLTHFRKPGTSLAQCPGVVGVSIAFDKIVSAAMEKANPVAMPTLIDALVCSLGSRSASITRELLAIVKELWAIGVSADVYYDGSRSLEEIKDFCRESHIGHLIVYKDTEKSLHKLQLGDKDRIIKKDFILHDLLDYFQRLSENAETMTAKSQTSSCTAYTTDSNSSSNATGNIGSGSNIGAVSGSGVGASGSMPQYDISFVLPDNNKLAKNTKRSYESQTLSNVTPTLSRLNKCCRVEILGVELGLSVIKSLAVHLDFSKDEDTLVASIATTVKEYPRYKKYLTKIVNEISDLKFENRKNPPIVIMYSLTDDAHRVLL